jgi:hypothetical protein
MINVQSYGYGNYAMSKHKGNSPSFSGNDDDVISTRQEKEEIREARAQFSRIKNDNESPSLIKKLAKCGEILGSAFLGGVSMKYGLEISMKAISKMAENKTVASANKGLKSIVISLKDIAKSLFETIKESNFGKNIAKKCEDLKQTPFGKTVTEKYNKFKETDVYKTVAGYVDAFKKKGGKAGKETIVSILSGASALSAGGESAGIIKRNDQRAVEKEHYENENADEVED